MILSICDDPDVLSVMRIIIIVINIVKIIVPIILIITGMISFTKAVVDSDYQKPLKQLVTKVVAAILVFFIPTFVSIVVNIFDTKDIYYSCIENATKEKIEEGYVNRAKLYVLNAKNSLSISYYQYAVGKVNKLKNSSAKEELTNELNSVYEEIQAAMKEREEKKKQGTSGKINPDGEYSKVDVIDMDEQRVRDMTNEEFIEFMASNARLVYAEYGGVLPSITIAQAILESGWGNSFESTSHNLFGLIGYPGEKPKVNKLRKFDNFYEATYYHYAYFQNYSNVYGNFLNLCASGDAIGASQYLYAYAGGSQTYAPKIISLINQYNLTQYDH